MKLLFDHNLSHRLVQRLSDIFPDSAQTRLLNFGTAPDAAIWEYAKLNGFVIVTLDKDFSDLAHQRGVPPKVIWLRCGNSRVADVECLLRLNLNAIKNFEADSSADILEIWP